MRRTLTIVAILIVLLGVAGAVYFFFFYHPKATLTTGPNPGSGGTTFPSSGQASTTSSGAGGVGTTTVTVPGTTASPFTVSPRLVEVTSGPVVPGLVVLDTKLTATSSPVATLQYIDRQSGNVYSYSTDTKTLTRTSNKTVPGIQSASWLPDGSFAYVRYLSGTDSGTINTYALSATGLPGFFLNQGLTDVSASSTGVLTIASGENGSVGLLTHTDGTGSATVFTSPLTAIRASFAGKGSYLVFTKPSGTLSGDAFLVNSAGRFSRIAGPLDGLVALASPSGKWAIVSYTTQGTLAMELVNIATGETTPLPVATIADKCVWAQSESAFYCGIPTSIPTGVVYPDDWYQGAVSFTDRIWKINVAGRYAELVLDFSKETKGDLDATALAIDPLGTTLTFVNKNDGSLWSFTL